MDIRYTLSGSALSKADKALIESLRAEVAALRGDARKSAAEVSPETARVAEVGMKSARAENAARKAEGLYCARHDHGFAFRKTTCPRDGGPLA